LRETDGGVVIVEVSKEHNIPEVTGLRIYTSRPASSMSACSNAVA
jgi:hypothetical protein